jgi:hypothetical protein
MSAGAMAGWPGHAFRRWPSAGVEPLTEREAGSRKSPFLTFRVWLAAFAIGLLVIFALAVLLLPVAAIRGTGVPQPSGQAQTRPVPPLPQCDPGPPCH